MEDKVTICFDRFKFSDSQNLYAPRGIQVLTKANNQIASFLDDFFSSIFFTDEICSPISAE